MRVICETIDDFLYDIETQIKEMDRSDCVLQKAIRVSKTSRTFGNDTNIRMIGFRCSAVLDIPDGGQYLLEMGVECGKDYHTHDKEFTGSEKADVLREQVQAFCNRTGLSIRPGLIEI